MSRQPVLPIEMELLPMYIKPTCGNGKSAQKYVNKKTNLKKKLYNEAHNNINDAQERQKLDYDRKRGLTNVTFQCHNYVKVYIYITIGVEARKSCAS